MSALVLLENSTVKYYREIKTQHNYLIYWELMCWLLTDKEESEGGEIVKQHNCPNLSFSCPPSFETFTAQRDVSCTAERDPKEHKCISAAEWVCEGGWAGHCLRTPLPMPATPPGSNNSCALLCFYHVCTHRSPGTSQERELLLSQFTQWEKLQQATDLWDQPAA